jgi:dephospho-CoA kinase
MNMNNLVISGGVGTGKSTLLVGLLPLFGQKFGSFSSDKAVAELYESHAFMRELNECFGQEALQTDELGATRVDRRWLRRVVLPDFSMRAKLDNLVHGYVLQALEEARTKAKEQDAKVFVAEVPLHYEIGSVISADLVIVVAASRSVQVRRMMENRRLDEATTQAFLDAQLPIETKVEKADVVIWNDGDSSALESQTLLLANLLNIE